MLHAMAEGGTFRERSRERPKPSHCRRAVSIGRVSDGLAMIPTAHRRVVSTEVQP